jgi:hypothetical protein
LSRPALRVVLANLMVPVVAWVIWDQYERRALAREIAALAARGEPTSTEALATGADTPERAQAARMYAAAAERAATLQPEVTFRLPTIDVDSTALVVNLDQLERTYPHDAAHQQLVDRAAPLDFNGFGDLEPDLERGALLRAGQLCALRADLLSARRRADAAAAALGSCVRVYRTLELFPRGQLSARLLGSVRILLRHGAPSREALAALQQVLETVPDTDDIAAETIRRRARFLDDIAAPRARVIDAVLSAVMRPWIARSNRQHLAAFGDALALAAQPWPRKFVTGIEMERSFGRGMAGPRGLIERQTFPPRYAYAGWSARFVGADLAARRVVTAAIAVERFRADHGGTPPPSLQSLVGRYLRAVPDDPFTGKPLVYTATATEYRLYSADTDQKDDGGEIYGLGSKAQRQPLQGRPRDLGVRVELRRQSSPK